MVSEDTKELLNQILWTGPSLFNWQVTDRDLSLYLFNFKSYALNDHSDFPLYYVQPGASLGSGRCSVSIFHMPIFLKKGIMYYYQESHCIPLAKCISYMLCVSET